MLLVASAGNLGYDKKGTITFPAAYRSVIAVGAIDQNNIRATFSSVGKELELVAPGVDIKSFILSNQYGEESGTSMAAPHITGSLALIWAYNSNLNNVNMRNIIDESAIPLGDSFEYGNGLINIKDNINY